jgi:predicted nicotinamide N-methyase
MQALHASLQARAKQALRAARLEPLALPQCPAVRLYLLNADFSSAALSPAEIEAAMHMPCYWLFCWASGQVLARHILEHPDTVRGKVVADFGAGSGVVAIACALAGARTVYACDIDPDSRDACELNARLNGVHLQVVSTLDEIAEPLDLVAVADVLYDRDNLPLLPLFLRHAPQVLLADSRLRNMPDTSYRLLGEYDSCTLPDLDEHAEFRRVRIYGAGAIEAPAAFA